MTGRLPWHAPLWERLGHAAQADRIPHALLLRGPAGLGKRIFARQVAAVLLCGAPASDWAPCGQCRGCELAATEAHPDRITIGIPEDKNSIGIETIRAAIEHVSLTAAGGAHKVALVDPAEALTHPAANTLLKVLEEPPGPSVFLLVSNHGAALPATIRSRCQNIEFAIPPTDVASAWLAQRVSDGSDPASLLRLADGAPIRALELAQEDALAARDVVLAGWGALLAGRAGVVEVAERWKPIGPGAVAAWTLSLTQDLLRMKASRDPSRLTHADRGPALQEIDEALDSASLYRLHDHLVDLRRVFMGQTKLNDSLALESIAFECLPGGRTRGRS